MRVLFVNPPTFKSKGGFNRPIRFPTFNYATPVMHPPLFLAYAAAYIRSCGHEVEIIDAPVQSMCVDEFLSEAKRFFPDFVVCETSTPSFYNDLSVARRIKDQMNCKVVFVGTHVSALPKQCVENKDIDAVVIGEYELSLEEYIRRGPENTKGICYRDKNNRIILNPPREYIQQLDTLPFPARDLLPNYKYFDPILKNPFTFVFAGRGCPYRCVFCNWPQVLTGRKYRHRSVNNIVDELEEIKRNYRFESFLFNDDTFTIDRAHCINICNEMIRRNLDMKWACYVRGDESDEELLTTLKQAGCFLLKVGVESGNQRILNNAKKGYKIENIRKAIKLMMELGFHVHATFVFGLPGETEQTIKQSIEFAKQLNPTTVQFSTAVPYPGTEFFDYLSSKRYFITERWDKFMPLQPIFQYEKLSADRLVNAVSKAYRSYYFRLKYISVGIKELFIQPRVLLGNFKKLVTLCFRGNR